MKRLVSAVLILMDAADNGQYGDGADYKIGVVTGTVSQGEDEYRGAENAVAKYGDMIARHLS